MPGAKRGRIRPSGTSTRRLRLGHQRVEQPAQRLVLVAEERNRGLRAARRVRRPAFSTTHAAPKHPPEGVSRLMRPVSQSKPPVPAPKPGKKKCLARPLAGCGEGSRVTAFDPCFRAEVFQIYPQGRIPALQHCRNHPLGNLQPKVSTTSSPGIGIALGSPGNELNHPVFKGIQANRGIGRDCRNRLRNDRPRDAHGFRCSLASCSASRQHTPISPKLSTSLQKMSHTLCVDDRTSSAPRPAVDKGLDGLERMWVSASNPGIRKFDQQSMHRFSRPSQEFYEQGQGLDLL